MRTPFLDELDARGRPFTPEEWLQAARNDAELNATPQPSGIITAANLPTPKPPPPSQHDAALQDQARPQGPGSVLAGLFKSLGFKQEGGCGCSEMQNKMNAWGVEGCREHQDEILDFLEAKARTQNIPFARLAAKIALETVIFKIKV